MSMGDSFKYSNHVCPLGIYLSMRNIYALCVIHLITHNYVYMGINLNVYNTKEINFTQPLSPVFKILTALYILPILKFNFNMKLLNVSICLCHFKEEKNSACQAAPDICAFVNPSYLLKWADNTIKTTCTPFYYDETHVQF